MSSWETLRNAFISSVISKTIVSPLERLKMIYQTSNCSLLLDGREHLLSKNIAKDLRLIYQIEGVLGFFKGNMLLILRYAIQQSIAFSLNFYHLKQFKRKYSEGRFANVFMNNLVVSGVSGTLPFSLLYSLESLRTYFLTNKADASLLDPFKTNLRYAYNGFWVGCLAYFLYRGFIFNFHDLRKQWIPNLSFTAGVFSNYIGTIVASTFAHPFDTIRKQMNAKSLKTKSLIGFNEIASDIWKTKGTLGFFDGWGINAYRSLGAALALAFFDLFMGKSGSSH